MTTLSVAPKLIAKTENVVYTAHIGRTVSLKEVALLFYHTHYVKYAKRSEIVTRRYGKLLNTVCIKQSLRQKGAVIVFGTGKIVAVGHDSVIRATKETQAVVRKLQTIVDIDIQHIHGEFRNAVVCFKSLSPIECTRDTVFEALTKWSDGIIRQGELHDCVMNMKVDFEDAPKCADAEYIVSWRNGNFTVEVCHLSTPRSLLEAKIRVRRHFQGLVDIMVDAQKMVD